MPSFIYYRSLVLNDLLIKMEFSHEYFTRLILFLLIFAHHFKQHESVSADEGEIMIFAPMIGDAQHINLESKHSYSVLLKLQKEEHADNTHERNIEYIVRAPDYAYYGIMAIVQNLYLRTINLEAQAANKTLMENVGDICRDYIQFFNVKHNTSSEKICGLVNTGDTQFYVTELIGPRIYYNDYGSLGIRLHIDEHVYEYDKDDPNLVGAEIAVTAYTACPSTDIGIQKLTKCSEIEIISCIPNSLFCDGKIDCGFQNSFGVDEKNCFAYKYSKHGIVMVVFGFFILLLLYCFVYWLRRNYSQ